MWIIISVLSLVYIIAMVNSEMERRCYHKLRSDMDEVMKIYNEISVNTHKAMEQALQAKLNYDKARADICSRSCKTLADHLNAMRDDGDEWKEGG